MGRGRDMLGRWADRLARTRYGQKALATQPDLSVFRRRPTPRFYLGLCLVALSFILGWLVAGLGVYLIAEGEFSWLVAAVAVGVVVGVHLIFAAGVWLSGDNYAAVLMHWLTRWYLLRHGAAIQAARVD